MLHEESDCVQEGDGVTKGVDLMSVKIGHARGGDPTYTPGDQTGTEVRTQSWYANGWNFVLRFRSATQAEKAAKACEAACANDNIGYSQIKRNDLRAAALVVSWDFSRITSPADCDCSSLMAVCAEAAGIDMSKAYTSGNAPWTGNMKEKFSQTGAFEVLTDKKYLTSDTYLRRGDILVNEITHTCMALSNGSKAYEGMVSSTGATSIKTKTHIVDSGDTLWGIAQTYGVTVAAICAANGLDEERFIFPGQNLIIPI